MIVADSEAYYRSSVIELEGNASPKTFWMDFREVPARHYSISAVVKNRSGHNAAMESRDVRVIGIASEP